MFARLLWQKADIEEQRCPASTLGELVVKELTPSLRDDFLHFFDTVAFADNPDWSDCYCSAYHFANNKGKAESRREASSLIEDDRMHGIPRIRQRKTRRAV